MFRKLFVLLLALATFGCANDAVTSNKENPLQCLPAQSFTPVLAEITLSGYLSFSDKISEYYFDLSSDKWSCDAPSSPVVNVFKDSNAETLIGAIKKQKNNIQDILEISLEFDSNQNFRKFVNRQCSSAGLSYLFEVSETIQQKIYGCQINPQVKSAIMWKQTSGSKFIELAYLPLYQPIVDRITQLR